LPQVYTLDEPRKLDEGRFTPKELETKELEPLDVELVVLMDYVAYEVIVARDFS